MRGWNPDVETDNFKLRQSCIESCDLDIIGVAETHLYDAQTIKLNGFEWYGMDKTDRNTLTPEKVQVV